MAVFTDAAARRYARLAIEESEPDHDLITREPGTPHREAAHLVDEWFADLYGWPLNRTQRVERHHFLTAVYTHIARMQEARR